MRFAAAILYVPDVPSAVDFYVAAFGLTRGFADDSGSYATLAGDGAVLAFASYDVAPPAEGVRERPGGFEIWLETADVAAAYEKAVGSGAEPVAEPVVKPWGQTVAYVRDPNGTLIELGSPVG
jgi:lactoylglutathione lyase